MSDGKDTQTFVIMSKDEYRIKNATAALLLLLWKGGRSRRRKRRRRTNVRIKMGDSSIFRS